MRKLESMTGVCRVPALALILAAGLLMVDGAASAQTPGSGFSGQALLASIGGKVMIPTYNAFSNASTNLVNSLINYCNAVKTNFNAANPAGARLAWRAAMGRWQAAEMLQFGPVAMNSGEIRNNIYSWPIENTCSVDQNVINSERNQNPDGTSPFNITATAIDSRGLSAIAYLLFAANKNHTCPVQITVTQGWNARPLAAREAARCAYATAAASNVRLNAQRLVNAWAPGKGNYLRQLVAAGAPGSAFGSAQEAINTISDAMFYLETELKEMKLGEPLGKFDNNCGPGELCPEEIESLSDRTNNSMLDALIYNTGFAKQMLRANFVAFQRGFHGGDPTDPAAIGFDDFMRSVGTPGFAALMTAEIRALVTSLDDIEATLDSALVNDFRSVDDVYEVALQPVSIKLRNQFLSILGLEAPGDAASDTD